MGSQPKKFKRNCERCDKEFRPDGKFQKICNNCNKSNRNNNSKESLKNKYFKSKEQLDIIRSNATLAKWKVLSHAYKLGKKIWGSRFTRQRLAHDFDIPMTTVLRCLSLDRASKRSIKLMEDGKISAFQLAMICHSKSKTFQDEIVDLVINEKYSTYQIKSLKVNNLKDINKERLRLAVEKGFSRQSSAALGFKNWIDRGKLFLIMKKDTIGETKFEEIRQDLTDLNKRIELYLQ